MLDPLAQTTFETIHSTDLIYSPNCWKLCGDAHCCNLSAYKSQMKLIGSDIVLMLLPGELEYIEHNGGLAHFGAFRRRFFDYPLSHGTMRVNLLHAPVGRCPCNHELRPTICRLYPLLPVFEVDGRLAGIDARFTIFEEIEHAEGISRGCKITSVPFTELDKFMSLAGAIGRNPLAVFYIMAYRLVKQHAIEQFQRARNAAGAKSAPASPWVHFENLFARRKLLDQSVLRPQLEDLAAQFHGHYGPRFSLATS
jgi:hypothetical protein